MDPAEKKLFQRKVEDFDATVTCLIDRSVAERGEYEKMISTQQLWFQERPWVSHFVPHFNVVRERLKNFIDSTSVTPASQPAPPVRIGNLNLQPASPNPVPQRPGLLSPAPQRPRLLSSAPQKPRLLSSAPQRPSLLSSAPQGLYPSN